MKTKIKQMWEAVRVYVIALLGIIIGGSGMFNYQEYNKLIIEYNNANIIIENHFAKKAEAKEIVIEEVIEIKEEKKTEVGEFTAYSAGDGFTPGIIMASGKEVYEGAIACPSRFNFGDKIEVNGKIYTCEDRMAKRFRDGNYFDIYMNSQNEALKFGRRQLEFKLKQ